MLDGVGVGVSGAVGAGLGAAEGVPVDDKTTQRTTTDRSKETEAQRSEEVENCSGTGSEKEAAQTVSDRTSAEMQGGTIVELVGVPGVE